MGLECINYATAALGENLADGQDWERSGKTRQIKRIGFIGGSAVADTAIEIYYGTTKIAKVYNTVTGQFWTNDNLYWMSTQLKCFGNVPIKVMVVDAAPAAVTLILDIV